MTIRPHATDFILACDCCGHTRPLAGLDDVAQAIRVGWRRIVTDRPMVGHWIAGHHCARCACRPRSVETPAEVIPLGVPVGGGFRLLPEATA